MSKKGTTVDFNESYFASVLRTAPVETLTKERAQAVLTTAQATAPVKTGDYERGLILQKHSAQYRDAWRVVGIDWKTMLVESKTGNLARALRRTKG